MFSYYAKVIFYRDYMYIIAVNTKINWGENEEIF
jgi:hypothetical protein